MLVGDAVMSVQCIFDGSWRGIDIIPIEGGTPTRRYTDANSCPAGSNIWVPRTHEMVEAMFQRYGRQASLVGIYGRESGCGGCTGYAMNSGVPEQAAHWTSVGPETGSPAEPWFMREAQFSEPNGDYEAGCW